MKKLLILFLMLSSIGKSQGFQWVNLFSSYSDNVAKDLVTDNSGNIYVGGDFYSTMDIDPSITVNNFVGSLGRDIFLIKYNSNQSLMWGIQFGSNQPAFFSGMCIDGDGNILITGYFPGTIDFDTSTTTDNYTAIGSNDVFVAKYDPSGNYIWSKCFGGYGNDMVGDIAVDENGSIFVGGTFTDSMDFDPGIGNFTLYPNYNINNFVTKLSSNGNFITAINTAFSSNPGNGDQGIKDIKVKGNGVYICGYFSGDVDFDPYPTNAIWTNSGTGSPFVLKFDTSMSFIWAKAFIADAWSRANSLTIDSTNSVIVTGFFQGNIDFDPGPSAYNCSFFSEPDLFVTKLTTNGDFMWADQFSGSTWDEGASVTTDENDNIYLTGNYRGTLDFDPSPSSVYNVTTYGFKDAPILKLDPYGNYSGVVHIGKAGINEGFAIHLDKFQNLFIAGRHNNKTDFDPGPGTYIVTDTMVGTYDGYLLKLGRDILSNNDLDNSVLSPPLNIYPNPANENVNIFIKENKGSPTIEIINLQGQIIWSFTIQTNLATIDISSLSNGMYFIRAGNYITKFIKE